MWFWDTPDQPSELCEKACKKSRSKVKRARWYSNEMDVCLKTGMAQTVASFLEDNIYFQGVNPYISAVAEFNGNTTATLDSIAEQLDVINISTAFDEKED